MKRETLKELVKQRKGYKYLNKDRTSPYQDYKYVLRKGKVFRNDVNTDVNDNCGHGWNLATLGWIINDANILDKIIVEFSIPDEAKIIVPVNSNGKFRTDIIKYERAYKPEDAFPVLKNIKKKLKKYKPINPITAEKLPPKKKILKAMKAIGAQARDQVGAQVGAQVRAQVWDQVGAQARAQVWDQVGDQARVIAFYAVKLFMDLKYEHPAFDLIRMGIIVVNVLGKFKAFGKNGKFLGEIDKP